VSKTSSGFCNSFTWTLQSIKQLVSGFRICLTEHTLQQIWICSWQIYAYRGYPCTSDMITQCRLQSTAVGTGKSWSPKA
jgi:hypothetical protein